MTEEKNILEHPEEDGLKKLAASLILNAIETSCEDKNEFNDAFKFFINEKHRDYSDTLFWKDMNLLTSRNILIIGNGATMDALGKSQKAEDLANEIIAKVKVKYGDPLVKRQIDRLKTAYDLNEADFETKLSACAALDEEFVRKELKAALNYKYIPSRFYEIVGHLFKHRYIDVIINFNHDEILDEIIKEELNDSDYNHIFFDGHCPVIDDGSKVTELLKVPIYIKPHGTISYDNSMLFTKEHYHNEASGLKKFLHYIFTAKYKEPSENIQKLLDLNIIVAGCRLASSELNQIMDDALMERRGICENIANMFVFDTSEKEDFLYDHNPNAYAKYKNFGRLFGSEDDNKPDTSKSRVELKDKSYRISNEYILHGNFHYFKVDEDNTLGNQFQKLSSQIESFTSDFPPKNTKPVSGLDKILKRGIARHLLISELFCQPNANYRFYSKNRPEKSDDIFIEKSGDEINIYTEEGAYKDDKKELIKLTNGNLFEQKKEENESNQESSSKEFISYCKSRTIIEIIILGLQSRELLNITTIKESRAGKYYQLYVENSYYLINEYHLEVKQYEAASLIDLLKVVGYKNYKGYTNETFQFAPEEGKTILKKGKNTEKEIDFTVLVHEIPRLRNLDVNTVSKYFKAIKNSINYNIKPKFREYKLTNVSFNSIKNSDLLNSDIKYYYNFSKFFRETDTYGLKNWNVLLAIAERGEFIKNYLVDSVFSQDIESHKFISLVIADYCIGELSQKVDHLSKVNLIDSDSANADKLDNIPAIPFWLHNQHMFLFLHVKQEDVKPTLVGGIHYESRLLSKNVCPVFITDKNQEDLEVMLTTFIEYWTKGHLHRNTSFYKQKIANICRRQSNELPDFYNPIYDQPIFTELQKLLLRQLYNKVYPGLEPPQECPTIIEPKK